MAVLPRTVVKSRQALLFVFRLIDTGLPSTSVQTTVCLCRHILPSAEEMQHARSLLFTVPYSLHSSYAELHAFVKRLRPGAVEPIVQGDAAKDPRLHFSSLLRWGKRPKPLHLPPEAESGSRKTSRPKAWQASHNKVYGPQGSVSAGVAPCATRSEVCS